MGRPATHSENRKIENYRYENQEAYRLALDHEPPGGWIKNRDIGGGRTWKYIPISCIQALADIMFREWSVIEEKPLYTGNGIGFTVKIQALPDYPGADYIFFTGSGAVPFQEKKNAVEYNFPAARSKAITTAFSDLGNIFGRNVGRTVENVPIGNGFTLRKKEEKEEKEK